MFVPWRLVKQESRLVCVSWGRGGGKRNEKVSKHLTQIYTQILNAWQVGSVCISVKSVHKMREGAESVPQ